MVKDFFLSLTLRTVFYGYVFQKHTLFLYAFLYPYDFGPRVGNRWVCFSGKNHTLQVVSVLCPPARPTCAVPGDAGPCAQCSAQWQPRTHPGHPESRRLPRPQPCTIYCKTLPFQRYVCTYQNITVYIKRHYKLQRHNKCRWVCNGIHYTVAKLQQNRANRPTCAAEGGGFA